MNATRWITVIIVSKDNLEGAKEYVLTTDLKEKLT